MSISDVFHPVYFDSILNGTKANLKNEFIKSDQTIQTNLKSISHRSITSQSSNHSNSNSNSNNISISTQSESSRNKNKNKNKNKSKKRVRSKPSHSVNCNNSNDLEHVIFLDWYAMSYIIYYVYP